MTAQFIWKEEYNIGVDIVDREHQQLFKIINKLFSLSDEEKNSQWVCQEGIKFFKGHAMKHFADEEEYMASIGYEGIEKHKRIHSSFRDNTLPALEEELEKAEYSPDAMEHFLGVCAGWLVGHTLTEDQSISGKNDSKLESLMIGEELDGIKRVIVQLVFDMFNLESQMISDVYSGEKFGKGIYYRLVYGDEQNETRKEVFMVFEESLLINTVGKVMGIQTNKLDNLLVHATRYTARQFVGRVLEHLDFGEEYELREENLMSYEQFQKVFEDKEMQVSMLFDTGAGYFSFCMIAQHLPENDIVTPIVEDNAMEEVEKYLAERNEQKIQEQEYPKPKILVVDDSITIRNGMKKLLCDDYEIALVESGIAAIRAITLNRPDLVLLDYEMPVCDGRQTLEMLRSEKTFEDIPVIFLTGRSDPDSVRNVMSLKPAGYLLKHLKHEEIKKKIDSFFDKRKAI